MTKDSFLSLAARLIAGIVNGSSENNSVPNSRIPYALPCRFSVALKDRGHLTPATEGEDWKSSHVVAIREVDHTDPASPLVVAVITQSAQPIPFHADYDDGTMSTPVGEFDLPHFRRSFIRCDEEGNLVGTFFDPAWLQLKDAVAADSTAHRNDIAEMVLARRRGSTVADEIEWRLFDIAQSEASDGLSTAEVLERARTVNDRPFHLAQGLEGLVALEHETYPNGDDGHAIKLVLEGWHEIRVFPQYMIAGVRALFTKFMGDLIGDTPIEEVVRLHYPRGEMDAICEVFTQEGFDEAPELPPFRDEHMMRGGYETSIVRNFRNKGCAVVVFEDLNGAYAYAFPAQSMRA